MNRKGITIILSLALIVSFFLPLDAGASGGSAFDIVKGPSFGNSAEAMLMKYVWILIPLSGVILLIGALNNDNYILGRSLWTLLPLLTILYLIVWPVIQNKVDMGVLVKNFGIGMWIAVVASLVVAFYHPRRV